MRVGRVRPTRERTVPMTTSHFRGDFMSVSLTKGQKISLSKEAAGVNRLMVGLGWDPVAQGSKGILGSLFGSGAQDIDCDASAIMLNGDGKLTSTENVVYFGRLKSKDGSIQHMGDNLTGDGDGDDEQISVDLERVPESVHRIAFVVNIYDCVKRKQNFGMLQNAFIRIVDAGKGTEILRYDLAEKFDMKTALIAGEIYRNNGEWKFSAIGEGTNVGSLTDLVKRYK